MFAILNRRGDFLAYRRSDWSLIFSARKDLARTYKTLRGARIAATSYFRRYGHPVKAAELQSMKCTSCKKEFLSYDDVHYDGPKEKKASSECSPFMEWETLCEKCYSAMYPEPPQELQEPL